MVYRYASCVTLELQETTPSNVTTDWYRPTAERVWFEIGALDTPQTKGRSEMLIPGQLFVQHSADTFPGQLFPTRTAKGADPQSITVFRATLKLRVCGCSGCLGDILYSMTPVHCAQITGQAGSFLHREPKRTKLMRLFFN